MRGRKIRRYALLSNICKVFCFAHTVVGIMMILGLDSIELSNLLAYLAGMVYCILAAVGLGICFMELDYRRELMIHGELRNL